MSQIAARFGGSKATVYNYFPSKEELFFEVVRHAAESQGGGSIADVLQTPGGLREVLHALGDHIVRTISSPHILTMLRTVVAESGRSRLGQIFYEKGMQLAWQHVKDYLSEAVQKGHLIAADPEQMTMHLKALYEAQVRDELLFGVLTEVPEERRTHIVSEAVAVFLRAYGK